MSDHYFSPAPVAPSEPGELEVQVRGLRLVLLSDRGVFSHAHADPGSLLLARHLRLPQAGGVLDLGCGYGLLGIVAATLCPRCHVVLVDINRRAAALAAENCRRQRLSNTEVLAGDAREVLGVRRFSCVLCNPPYRAGKVVVMALLEEGARRLEPGGTLWIVGRTKQGIKTLARDLGKGFQSGETVAIKGGYRVLAFRAEG